MVTRLDRFLQFSERWIPDPFVLALILTVITYGLGFTFVHASFSDLTRAWYRGFWELLSFSMQMVLILITGYVLAAARPIHALILWIAAIPRSGRQAVFICGTIASIAALLHWGFGLVVGAFLARELGILMKKRGVPVHYPLLGAAGYLGLAVWHGGLSGSAPLLVASPRHFLIEKMGVIPISQTIFHPLNLVLNAVAILFFPIVLALFHPRQNLVEAPDFNPSFSKDSSAEPPLPEMTPAQKVLYWRGSSALLGLVGFALLIFLFITHAVRHFDLNAVIFVFLFAGMILHGILGTFLTVFYEAARTAGPIVLQFPFYGGIMGIMKYTPLGPWMAKILMGMASPALLPFIVYLSAGIVNLFVPSGGGQWAVQGPIVVEAAVRSDVSIRTVLMAVAYGDEWTNLAQPFWALPLLAITGLEARHIMGYTLLLLPFHLILFGGGLILHGLF